MEILNLTIPTCWQELSPKQLRYVYFLLSQDYTAEQLKTLCLCRWAGIEIVCPEGDGYSIRHDFKVRHITALQIAEVLHHLDWLDSLPAFPVRLAAIGKHQAVSADLQGVSFEHYIVLDNLYQGYLHTRNTQLLEQMAAYLYNAPDEAITLTEEERISIFYWFASVKQLFARKFKHFFVTADNSISTDLRRQIEDGINAQIRALTKGDITKEDTVLHSDVYRALTELDALAREYEELKKQTKI
ncbi:MAG: hypothetical protein MJZ82_03070 [Paludibacteraceae bacterium]|nr:hypothetical protein [Paludibacteraceae bacterium]